jgi:hydroxypyruvate isomerase
MPRLSCNISTRFNDRPMPDRIAAAAQAGFAAVEIQFPYDHPAPLLARAANAAGVQVVLINMPAGDFPAEIGFACLPDRQPDFEAAIDKTILYAETLQCPQVNCLAGRPAGTQAAAWSRLKTNLAHAADRLGQHGIRLLVEPLNRIDFPGYLIDGLPAADAILRDTAHANLALQYDIYHLRANDEDWLGGLAPRIAQIGHIQFADYPGRGPPGTGTIDFRAFFSKLTELRYTGWIGCEYRD